MEGATTRRRSNVSLEREREREREGVRLGLMSMIEMMDDG